MVEIEPEYVEDLRKGLSTLFDRSATYIQSQVIDPAEGSPAASEFASASRPESIATAISMASMMLESSGEHVTLFVKTITDPVEPIACWTCVRSMLEASALVVWLLDAKIDAFTRIGRTFALRYEGMEQHLKFGRCLKMPTDRLEALADAMDQLERLARSLGYAPVHDRNGRRLGVGQRMPSATEVIGQMLGQEDTYRLLSAVAHAHPWAIQHLGFEQAVGLPKVPVGSTQVTLFAKKVSVRSFAFLGLAAAKAFGMGLWTKSLFMGWDKPRLVDLLESCFDILRFKDDSRFWR